MPIYKWVDKKSGKSVDIIRAFNDYEVPPTAEEAPGLEEPEWERSVGDNIQVIRPWNWQGKGNW